MITRVDGFGYALVPPEVQYKSAQEQAALAQRLLELAKKRAAPAPAKAPTGPTVRPLFGPIGGASGTGPQVLPSMSLAGFGGGSLPPWLVPLVLAGFGVAVISRALQHNKKKGRRR